jgi:predicted esterase
LDGGVWYNSYKEGDAGTEGCDFALDASCAYDMTSVDTSGQNVAALIDNEVTNNGISASNIYLAGYSQGG